MRRLLPLIILPVAAGCGSTEPSPAPAGREYTVVDLGTFGGVYATATAINPAGVIAGISRRANEMTERMLLLPPGETAQDIGPMPGFDFTAPAAINSRRQIAGNASNDAADMTAFIWEPAGGFTSLGSLGGNLSIAEDINERGEIVGRSWDRNGEERVFLWRPGQGMMDLGTLGGLMSINSAYGINDAGQVVGMSDGRAFIWDQANGMRELGIGGSWSAAYDINAAGVVVGEFTGTDGVTRGFRWTSSGGMEDLGAIDGGFYSSAQKISANGHILFAVDGAAPSRTFWVLNGGELHRLGPLVAGGWIEAYDLNDCGHAVGHGLAAGDERRAVMWTTSC